MPLTGSIPAPQHPPGCMKKFFWRFMVKDLFDRSLHQDIPSSPVLLIWVFQVCPAASPATWSNSPPGGDQLTALSRSWPKCQEHIATVLTPTDRTRTYRTYLPQQPKAICRQPSCSLERISTHSAEDLSYLHKRTESSSSPQAWFQSQCNTLKCGQSIKPVALKLPHQFRLIPRERDYVPHP